MSDRELTMDDYVAMLKRRLKVILAPLAMAALAGFLISYVFPPRYTSQSTVLVEGQKVPSNYVLPVITADFTQRIQTLSQQVMSASRLRPMIQDLGLAKPGEEGDLIANIRENMTVTPVITSMSAAEASAGVAAKKKPTGTDEPLPGFNVNYTDSSPARAQKICNALTSLIVDENLRSRADIAKDTTDFLQRQVDDAKRSLDEQDAKLAAFKKQYLGQLPGDVENNMRMLMTLNSQLDATTQTLSRAQQDKTYTEGMLSQQLAAWRSSQSSANPQTLEQQLSLLQAQLVQLQARYTDDHPDVIKTKADIAQVQATLDQLKKKSSTTSSSDETADANEPPEVRQLRLQIHQYLEVISQATSDQKKLQAQINVYESRTAMSPAIEEQYKELSRDYDNAQKFYADLLAKKSSADLGSSMEIQQQGEQMTVLQPAGKPESPSFPVRPLFAAAGLGAGLGLGVLIAVFLEFSDRSIRTEKDAAAATDLPLLISLPWLTDEEEDQFVHRNGNGRRRFWSRPDKDHEKVEV
jgi:polysaccharide chain length determinant protein (PEP-CTERM system associated)